MAKQKLGSPAFIIAVLILVLNDWYFKQTFHNGLTGKLSDFAGLFAFPFLLSALFPRKATDIYIFTFFFFLAWKSPLTQPIIDTLNLYGLSTYRVIDYSDYWALMVLPLSFWAFNTSKPHRIKPALLNVIVLFSAISFVATSRPPGHDVRFDDINKIYSFNFSKRELITKLNKIQMSYVNDMNKYISNNGNLAGGDQIKFDERTGYYIYSNSKIANKTDTIAQIIDPAKIKEADTVFIKTELARISISGDEATSRVKLLSLTYYVKNSEKGDHQQKAIEAFDWLIIKKLKDK